MPLAAIASGLFRIGSHRGVRLVARLNDPAWFDAPEDVVRVFVPDLHLLPPGGAARWRFSFERDRDAELPERVALLKESVAFLVDSLGGDVELYQLGDFIDFWRADEDGGSEVPAKRHLEDVLGRYKFLDEFVTKAEFVAGNHDGALLEIGADAGMDVEKSRLLSVVPGGPKRILVTHGDAFDPIESMASEAVRRWMLNRFGTGVEGSTYDLSGFGPGTRPAYRMTSEAVAHDEVVGVRDARWTNPAHRRRTDAAGGEWADADRATHPVVDDRFLGADGRYFASELTAAHELLPRMIDGYRAIDEARLCGATTSPYGRQRLDLLGLGGLNREDLAGADSPASGIQLMVVGHSHHPRIVRCEEVRDPYGGAAPVPTGRRFVLMDCGAWVERAVYRGDGEVASCHLGVQCGSDLRIYQFDPTS